LTLRKTLLPGLLAIVSTACGDMQGNQPAPAQTQWAPAPVAQAQQAPPVAQAQPMAQAQPANTQLPAPTAQSLAFAQQLGLPAVLPRSGVVGPYVGANQTVVYLNYHGLMTVFIPNQNSAYLMQMVKGQTMIMYGISGAGYFQATSNGQMVPLQNPNILGPWPHSIPIAQYIAFRQQQVAASPQGQAWLEQQMGATQGSIDMLRQQIESGHENMTTIIETMNPACTDQYDQNNVHLGCW